MFEYSNQKDSQWVEAWYSCDGKEPTKESKWKTKLGKITVTGSRIKNEWTFEREKSQTLIIYLRSVEPVTMTARV